MRHQRGKRQNGEVKPSSENNSSASSTVRLLHSGSRRSGPYQTCAKRQHLARGITSPRDISQSLHHFSTCSSDQKSNIVFQLKTMSSHQCAARNGEMSDTARRLKRAIGNLQIHGRATTATRSLNSSVLLQHCRYPHRIPNAVAVVGTSSSFHQERCGHR